LHLAWGVATVAFAFPLLPRRARAGLKARWSRQLLEVLGVRLRLAGNPPTGGLFVANHISWLDIFAINTAAPAAFVSKDDVRDWPLIGWLSEKAETIFLERGSRAAARRAKELIGETLRQQRRVAVFPEGTTGLGEEVHPFHGAMFQSAIDSGVPVVPVAIRYADSDGARSIAAAYVGDTSLWQCMRSIASASGLNVRVEFLATIDPAGLDRRHIAAHAHRTIAHALDLVTPSHPARPGAGTATGTLDGLRAEQPSNCLPTDIRSPAQADSAPA
jgi:1-acyl-sn-glycerol-3-phosphate acyltransferase